MNNITEKLMDYLEYIAEAVVILVVGLILIKIITKIFAKALKKSKIDAVAHKFIISVIRIAFYIVLLVIILSSLKVPTAPLVTVLGASGAAIALALKDSLGNIAGGIIILANKPFAKGDVIDVAGTSGIVESIDVFVTTLKTLDNKVVSVPNGSITTSVIVNYSRENYRRVDCVFGISYDSDIAKAKDVLIAVAQSNSSILEMPAPIIGVAEHGESSVLLDMKVWCKTSDYFDVKYYLEENVKLAFDKADITIPYPQMDVRVIK